MPAELTEEATCTASVTLKRVCVGCYILVMFVLMCRLARGGRHRSSKAEHEEWRARAQVPPSSKVANATEVCCRSRRREDTWLTEGLPELRPSGLMGPAPLPAGPIYFLQYQGPPALSRGPDGKWQNKSPIFCMTVSTAAHFNLSLGVLGPAVKMKDEKGGKGPALLSYLSQIPNGSLVIFYDAQDVFVLRDTAAILEIAETFDLTDTIVFGAERNCWAYQFCRTYPTAPTSYRYLNSGAFLARNGPHFRAFIEAWTRCIMMKVDDQNCVHWFYHRHPRGRMFLAGAPFRIALDHHCRLFQTGWGTKIEGGPKDRRFHQFDGDTQWVEDQVLTNPETQTRPAFVHFNGGKQFMKYYHDLLYPGLTWEDPRINSVQFWVWGYMTPASELCAA